MSEAKISNSTTKTKKTAAAKPKIAKTRPVPSSFAVKPSESFSTRKDGTPSRTGQNLVTWAVAFILGLTGGFIAVGLDDGNSSVSSQVGEQVVLQESELISSIAEKVGPSVVSINIASTELGFFGTAVESEGAGTGIIISEDGFVVTNRHVLPESITSVSVVLSDGTVYDDVSVIGRDPFTDIAYLKINNVGGLTPAELGSSKDVRVGDKVIAIGNALGEFSNTVTSGIISGLSRPIVAGDGTGATDSLQNLFQTDASINPGNSGGPLVNSSGQVIGINTAVAGNAENIGFAIPLDDVIGGIQTVLDEGELIKPYLGVRYITLSPEVAESVGVAQEQGAYLDSNIEGNGAIVADSPAEKAGLMAGDVIVKAAGEEVTATNSLPTIVGRFRVGDVVTLTVVRDGAEQDIDVVLERVPESLR